MIIINSRGLKDEEPLNIFGYTINKMSTTNELLDGSVTLVKNDIQHKIKHNYIATCYKSP